MFRHRLAETEQNVAMLSCTATSGRGHSTCHTTLGAPQVAARNNSFECLTGHALAHRTVFVKSWTHFDDAEEVAAAAAAGHDVIEQNTENV